MDSTPNTKFTYDCYFPIAGGELDHDLKAHYYETTAPWDGKKYPLFWGTDASMGKKIRITTLPQGDEALWYNFDGPTPVAYVYKDGRVSKEIVFPKYNDMTSGDKATDIIDRVFHYEHSQINPALSSEDTQYRRTLKSVYDHHDIPYCFYYRHDVYHMKDGTKIAMDYYTQGREIGPDSPKTSNQFKIVKVVSPQGDCLYAQGFPIDKNGNRESFTIDHAGPDSSNGPLTLQPVLEITLEKKGNAWLRITPDSPKRASFQPSGQAEKTR